MRRRASRYLFLISIRIYRTLLSPVKVRSKIPSRSELRARFKPRRKMLGRRHLAVSPAHGAWQLLCSLWLSSCLRGLPARVPEQKMYLRNGRNGSPLQECGTARLKKKLCP